MKNIAYIRASTLTQSKVRQLQGVEYDEAFEDKVNGKGNDLPGLNAMIKFLREGDVVHVDNLSRLGRNIKELRELIAELISKGVTVKFHKEQLTFSNSSDAMSKLLLNMLSAIEEFEQEVLLEYPNEAPFEHQSEAPLEHQSEAPLEHQSVAPLEHQSVAPLERQSVAPLERQSVAPFERENEGVGKGEVKYRGRKASIDNDMILSLLEGGMSIRKVAARLGLGVSTVQRAKKRGVNLS